MVLFLMPGDGALLEAKWLTNHKDVELYKAFAGKAEIQQQCIIHHCCYSHMKTPKL
jgi:hypothetical protein